eukprot:CAMPEP_0178384998 /NCGR_PEP_ID=MMETSP0689_2-20121128/7807_1 /TAXON_ID=160604 /ORGANISM="Amphidinium massartii, Strain CS-259" /LENGTH=54 /DNA_ID=CAMNT_0020005269 /DNA_START=212 /DNA_END=376 /DNA_ORIENTATION=-
MASQGDAAICSLSMPALLLEVKQICLKRSDGLIGNTEEKCLSPSSMTGVLRQFG